MTVKQYLVSRIKEITRIMEMLKNRREFIEECFLLECKKDALEEQLKELS